jgi:hypothetical protein
MGNKQNKVRQKALFADSPLERETREWHTKLFPEEYDHMFDDGVDAKLRSKGVNPMSDEYVALTNSRRATLGFGPYTYHLDSPPTQVWVRDKIQSGQIEELQQLLEDRQKEDLRVEKDKELTWRQTQASPDFEQKIDHVLYGDKTISNNPENADLQWIAFRLLGVLFDINKSGSSELAFYTQIKRLYPDLSDADYTDLYQFALNKWTDAYTS